MGQPNKTEYKKGWTKDQLFCFKAKTNRNKRNETKVAIIATC